MSNSREVDTTDERDDVRANPGYVLGRLAQAFATSHQHEDPETRARARKKVDNWLKVYEGMLSGALQVGSRTPVADTPTWATLEVVQGGFTTGELLAGGPLQPHEQELLSGLPRERGGTERAGLNTYYLTDPGIAELRQMVASGCYRVHVPEEAALLVVAWLLEHGRVGQARSILDEVGPFLSRLRFYPVPDARPITDSSVVHLRSVRETIGDLERLEVPARVQVQREATQVWAPLCDRTVELFIETLEGSIPYLKTGPEGRPLRAEAGKFFIEGGWPCQHYPEGWQTRAQTLLEDYRRLRGQHSLCGKPDQPTQNFAILRGYLETCAKDPCRLTGRDVGMVRFVLASIVTSRGTPDSERCRQLRETQARIATRPTAAELARVLVVRLSRLPQDDGVDSLEEILAPVAVDEASQHRLEAGEALAERLGPRVRRCLAAPVETLVELRVIPSGEVLAQVTPQITAQVRAAGLVDPHLRRLYGAIYRAFRRRRSLLLLNLESQVKLDELPWVKAINEHRRDNLDGKEQARQTLEQLVVLALTAFPHQILPNKLLQEIRALAEGAGLRLPLVDEVAADIFMGTFSEKFLRAAQQSGELLQGTLYERYYGIPYARVREMTITPSRYGTPTSPAFDRLCAELAGTGPGRGSVACNGTIIEQEQILTTHNLAVLFSALGLTDTLRPRLGSLARGCFEWICRRQQHKIDTWKARLQMAKNTAYAWRQMIFFLSLVPRDVVGFLGWASRHLGKQRTDYQDRFRPALEGLIAAAGSGPGEDRNHLERVSGPHRFLGWTTEKHWLLA